MTTTEKEAQPPPALCLSTYWESGHSRNLFASKALFGLDCDVKKIIRNQIENDGKNQGIEEARNSEESHHSAASYGEVSGRNNRLVPSCQRY
jgi:hypothetical protein